MYIQRERGYFASASGSTSAFEALHAAVADAGMSYSSSAITGLPQATLSHSALVRAMLS